MRWRSRPHGKRASDGAMAGWGEAVTHENAIAPVRSGMDPGMADRGSGAADAPLLGDADVGQAAVALAQVEAVADEELVRDR